MNSKKLEGSLDMRRCFTAANFDRSFIVRRNTLRDQWKIMGTEESKTNENVPIYFR